VRKLRVLALIVFSIGFALPSPAGTVYTATMQTDTGGNHLQLRAHAWANEGKVKLQFEASDNPLLPAGSYLLRSPDAVVVVNPAMKSYFRWNMGEYMRGLSAGMGPGIRIKDARFEKVSENGGGTVAGHKTRHYVFRLTYTMVTKLDGVDRTTTVERDEEFWATRHLAKSEMARDPMALTDALRNISSLNPELERMMTEKTSEIKGVVVRQVTRSMVSGSSGTVSTRIAMDISNVQSEDVPAAMFEVPSDYREVTMDVPSQQKPVEKGHEDRSAPDNDEEDDNVNAPASSVT
jgi:hypothetical protein